jgi:hypothetical protein
MDGAEQFPHHPSYISLLILIVESFSNKLIVVRLNLNQFTETPLLILKHR